MAVTPTQKILRRLLISGALIALWAMLSGEYDWMHLGTGVVVAFALTWYYAPARQDSLFPLLRFLSFVPWQIWQVIKSNIAVARIVLSPRMNISPVFIRRRSGLRDERALTIFACSLTLTPGTLTVEIDHDHALVHALDTSFEQDLATGELDRQVARIFGETIR